MKKTLLYSLFVASIAGLWSCSNDADVPVPQDEEISTRSGELVECLNITYKGKTYQNVPTSYDENGDFLFLDSEFQAIYAEELANDLDWSISAKDSHNITFYPDLKNNLDSNGIEVDESIEAVDAALAVALTRAGYNDLAEVTLYDDRDFKDRNYSFQLNDSIIYTEVANLKNKPWEFNDKCSSLILTNNMPDDPNKIFKLGYFEYPCSEIEAVFIGYDDRNFSDRTITCVAPPTSVKKYPSLPGFNDKMSSFKLLFAKKGQYQPSI